MITPYQHVNPGIYSGSGRSIKFSIKNNIPNVFNALPALAVEVTKEQAEIARVAHEKETPMLSGAMREQVQIVGYQKGTMGGTTYIQWRARNPKNHYPYPYMQENFQYENYTTAGTGPGFMEKTFETLKANLPSAMAEATRDLIRENRV